MSLNSTAYRAESTTPARVAVLRALQLGDLMCALPALRAMRAAWPTARMTLVGLPWARSFVARFSSYLDGFLEFPGFPGLPEQTPDAQKLATFKTAARSAGFDLAVQLHGDGRITNRFLPWLAAPALAGFYRYGEECPDPARFVIYPEAGPEILRLLALTDHLGLPRRGVHLEFPLKTADRQAAGRTQAAESLAPGRYVCLHPGARDPRRRWPAEHFGKIARLLSLRGYRVAVTGTAEEQELAERVCANAGGTGVNLAGKTSLGEFAALLSDARLLIANDTGVSHLAAALRVPSVIVFSASDPARWAPLDDQLHRAVGGSETGVPHSPTADEALGEVDALLGREQERIRVKNGPYPVLPPLHWEEMRRLLVICPGSEADVLSLGPTLAALRSRVPCAHIGLLTGPESQCAAQRISDFDSLVCCDPIARSDSGGFWSEDATVEEVRAGNFDAALILTRKSEPPYAAAYLCYLAGIPTRIGASHEFGGGLLTHWLKPTPDPEEPTVRFGRILEGLGVTCESPRGQEL